MPGTIDLAAVRAAARGSPAGGTVDDALDVFLGWTADQGLILYPAQEESLLEVFSGAHVIVNTPTGSGKSLIALGAHVAALAAGKRSFYTAPIKALVSEKFFALCGQLGAENVGMLTGDASINATAPVVCATAEIVANMALRGGAGTRVDQVVMDEFHYYGDSERGWAWQIPLLELPHAQFILMSATLGDTRTIEAGLTRRTGRPVAVVRSSTRPVPLVFEYRRTLLHATIESLLEADQAPLYVVHFTQAQALAGAQALSSTQVTTRPQREAIAEALEGYRFAPGAGRTLSRLLHHGIGVHHGGMLPKYRRLVERMTQAGLIRVVCGTDTLGVGVNLPLRTVVFTGLGKYDGSGSRLLTAREFHQIAGRAGRAGYDTSGLVVVQAPEHVVDNEHAAQKVAGDKSRARKLVKAKPPKGYVPWDEAIFDRMVSSPPEPLVPHMRVSHSMLLNVLDRPGDGCGALKVLLTANDEPRAVQRRLIRQSIAIYRSLVSASALEILPAPDDLGRSIRVTADLQRDFALDNPLSPFVLEAVPRLDASAPEWTLDVMSVIESTLDNPMPILFAQLDRVKTEAMAAMKAEGVEYEERIERLDKLEYPKPLREFTYDLYDAYRVKHPWTADYNIKPKSVARELFERSMTFSEYVAHYNLTRSEGLLLRYLSDVYRALVRNLPEDLKTDELIDITEWLGELVRQVDSSLIDEWEHLAAAAASDSLEEAVREVGAELEVAGVAGTVAGTGAGTVAGIIAKPRPLTGNLRAFRVMVRNSAFRRVELAARRDVAGLAEAEAGVAAGSAAGNAAGSAAGNAAGVAAGAAGAEAGIRWTASRWAETLDAYYAVHPTIGTGAGARSSKFFELNELPGRWQVRQILDDPEGWHDNAIIGEIDLEASDDLGSPAWRTLRLEQG